MLLSPSSLPVERLSYRNLLLSRSYIYIYMIIIICYSSHFATAQTLCSQIANINHTVTLSGTYNDHVVWSNRVILINGNVIFNKGIYFNNCTIKVVSNALITISESPAGFNYSTRILNSRICASSCNTMFEGFLVNPRRNLVLTNSVIEDAKYAITASNGSTLSLENNNFLRNFIGIRLRKLNTAYPSNVLFNRFSNNLFNCYEPLNLTIYHTSTGTGTNRSYVGLDVLDMISESIGFNANTPNQFRDLHIGMKIQSSSVSIENCSFENMIQLLHHDATDYAVAGYGIESNNSYVQIEGLGIGPTSTSTFQNCDVNQIRSVNDNKLHVTNCKIEFNKDVNDQIQVVHDGIWVYGGENIDLQLYSNNIIYQELKEPLASRYFTNTIIKIENTKIQSGRLENNQMFYNCILCQVPAQDKLVGIYMVNCPRPSSGFSIRNQVIDRWDYLAPMIHIANCYGLNIYDNPILRWNVLLSQGQNPKPVLLIDGGGDHQIFNNHIIGYHKNGAESIGIKISGSVRDSLCANSQYITNTGVLVEGASTGFNMAENKFENLGRGLYYVNGTLTMRRNEHKGNFWSGAFVNEEARHDGQTYPVNVYTSKRNNYGTSTKYWPIPLTPDNDQWFINRNRFENENLIGCPVLPGPYLDHWTPFLDEDFENITNPVQRWQLYKDFYRYVVDNNFQDSLSLLEPIFEYIEDSTTVPAFVSCMSEIEEIYSINDTLLVQLEAILDSLEIKDTILADIEVLIAQSTEDWTDSLQDQRNVILGELQVLEDEMDSVKHLIQTNQAASLISSRDCLDNLSEEFEHEADEKFCLQMLLKYFEADTFDISEIDQLEEIANSCINDKGNIVLLAQALLPDSMQFYRNTLWNCSESQALFVNSDQESMKTTNIYPNPVIDHLYLNNLEEAPKTIEVIDLKGKVLISIRGQNTNPPMIDVKSLLPGYYLLQRTTKSGEKIITRFIKSQQ